MRFAFVSVVVVLLAGAGTAHARHNGEPTIDHYVRAEGDGRLIANPSGHDVAWERCAPNGGPCSPHDDGDGQPNFMHARDDPVGSVFQATQDGVTVRSQPWRGVLRVVESPRIDGEVRVGGHVVPVAARWEGGWGRESDWLQMHACRNADGSDCKTIYDAIKFGRCPPGTGRYLPARYEGWWLAVADARIDKEQPFTMEGYFQPEGITPLRGAPGVAVSVVGQIAPGAPPPEDCGQERFFPPPSEPLPADPPSADAVARDVIRRDARGRLVAADVTCPVRCRAELRLRQRGRLVRVRRTLRAGTTAVALPRGQARTLRRGALSLRVLVDGREVAARRVRLAP